MAQDSPEDARRAARGQFLRGYRAFWVYTLARFALFAGIAAVLWAVGVPLLVAGLIGIVASVPLSWFLLRKPREAFAATIEERVDHRRSRSRDLEARLDAHPSDDDGPGDAVSEPADRSRAKRR